MINIFKSQNKSIERFTDDTVEHVLCSNKDECPNATHVRIPDGTTTIEDEAFRSNTDIISVIIPDSVTNIGESAFRECTSLTSVVIPDSVTSIWSNAFYGCSGLASVVIPDSVTSIGSNAFEGCSNLASVVIPDSVTGTTIGSWAFYNCSSLASVVIPDSVLDIGLNAFAECACNFTLYTAGTTMCDCDVEDGTCFGITTSSGSLDGGAIAGIVVGSLAFIALAAFVIF